MMPDGRRDLDRAAEPSAQQTTAAAVTPRPCCMSGSDGDRLREIDVVAPPLVPFLYPERVLRSRQLRGLRRYATGAKGPRIPEDQWPEVAGRAKREGLRCVARDIGVSHETVRTVLQTVVRANRAE